MAMVEVKVMGLIKIIKIIGTITITKIMRMIVVLSVTVRTQPCNQQE